MDANAKSKSRRANNKAPELSEKEVEDAVKLAEKITSDQVEDELMHENIKEGFSNEFAKELYRPDKLTEPIKTIEVNNMNFLNNSKYLLR
jgi:hypothetical protein